MSFIPHVFSYLFCRSVSLSRQTKSHEELRSSLMSSTGGGLLSASTNKLYVDTQLDDDLSRPERSASVGPSMTNGADAEAVVFDGLSDLGVSRSALPAEEDSKGEPTPCGSDLTSFKHAVLSDLLFKSF